MKVGDLVGSYRVTRCLGQGGMGEVFEAVHEVIGRLVAIKVLKSEWLHSAEISNRFLNEARAVNLIKHPSVVSIYEYGRTSDGAAYMVMEFLEGQTLASRISRRGSKPVPIPQVVRTGKQLAAALLAAHRQGVIHRDLKPDNIFIVPDPEVPGGERAKILDFGLAKLAAAAGQGPERVRTRSDVGMGTPDYMAPEQCFNANQVDGRADVYSLGCVLFELLTGRLPFLGEAQEVMRQRIVKDAPSLAELVPHASPALASIVQRMLCRDREARPAMDEVLRVFEELAAGGEPLPPVRDSIPQPSQRRRFWPILAAAGTAAALAGVMAVQHWVLPKLPQRSEPPEVKPALSAAAVGQNPFNLFVVGALKASAKPEPPPPAAASTPAAAASPPAAAASPSQSSPTIPAPITKSSATSAGPPAPVSHAKEEGFRRRQHPRQKPAQPVQAAESAPQPPPAEVSSTPTAPPPLAPAASGPIQPTRGLRNDKIPSLLDKLGPSRP